MAHDFSDRLLDRIEKLNAIGVGLSSEKNVERLMEMILIGAKGLTCADGGTIYSVTNDQRLRFEIMRTTSLGFAMGGTSGAPIPFEPLPLYLPDGTPNTKMVVSHAALTGDIVNIADAYETTDYDFSGTRAFDQRTGYRSRSFLTVPMKNHEETIIGVLQLINAIDPDSCKIVPFSETDQRLVASLASQASVSLSNSVLVQEMNHLFEAMIQLLATAIDDKSPYTGGHCRRVPVAAMLLADAVNRCQSGPLQDFYLDEAGQYELEIAAWLHDCGKVTTPEHIVDKARKLETIYDRIKEIDTRFEVVRRDAVISLLEEKLAAQARGEAAAIPALEEAFQIQVAQLEADRTFLRSCNNGEEFMSPGDQERVRAIAARCQWSNPDGVQVPFLDADEIENLTIARGTLNDRERDIINNHTVATIKMLESLPFPKHLRQVPEFAGGHHERMDGRGYPRALTGAQMSVQARIMALVDIFEALTASDRPYKKAKRLSEALAIMGKMALDQHIDKHLFQIFVHDRVYLDYARRFLTPEQIDSVDHSAIPGCDNSNPPAVTTC